jgi:hypothetical protein
LPPRIRYVLAWDHALCRAVVAVYLRAIVGWLRRRAGGDRGARAQGGAVAILQRFGGALNLNVHVHALVLDGVFVADGPEGGVRFRAAWSRGAGDIVGLLATIARRIDRLLARRGVSDPHGDGEAADPCGEAAPVLAGLAAASVRGVAALGPRAGVPVRRWGDSIDAPAPTEPGRWYARQDGFSLHAGVIVAAGARDRLERVCRYALRPALGQDRLQLTPDGKAVLELRRRWTDGTTHLVFEPVELLERLAALTPRPRVNLILYHGVLAPRAAWRKAIVPPGAPEPEGGSSTRLGSSREGAASGRGPSESQLGGADAARLRV